MMHGELDLVLNDQRRAFSDEFENYELAISRFMVILSDAFPLQNKDYVDLDELRKTSCILISSKGTYGPDEQYYRDVIGFSGSFLYAESLEEARLLAVSGRGFLPHEGIGKELSAMKGTRVLPLYRNGNPIRHRFCAFWLKSRAGYYVEEFARIFASCLGKEDGLGLS
jgi:hypothetical protein